MSEIDDLRKQFEELKAQALASEVAAKVIADLPSLTFAPPEAVMPFTWIRRDEAIRALTRAASPSGQPALAPDYEGGVDFVDDFEPTGAERRAGPPDPRITPAAEMPIVPITAALAALKAEVRHEMNQKIGEYLGENANSTSTLQMLDNALIKRELSVRREVIEECIKLALPYAHSASMYHISELIEKIRALAASPAVTQTEAEIRREEAQWWADEQVEKDGELSARGAIRLAEIDASAPPAVTRDKDEK